MSIFFDHPQFSQKLHPATHGEAKGTPMASQLTRRVMVAESLFAEKESARNAVASIDAEIGFEAAAVLASASPLGISAMGAFPSSLVGFGRVRRCDFDAALP